VSSSYFALQFSLFGSEETALAFNATLTPVLTVTRELEGMHLSLRGEGFPCELIGALIL